MARDPAVGEAGVDGASLDHGGGGGPATHVAGGGLQRAGLVDHGARGGRGLISGVDLSRRDVDAFAHVPRELRPALLRRPERGFGLGKVSEPFPQHRSLLGGHGVDDLVPRAPALRSGREVERDQRRRLAGDDDQPVRHHGRRQARALERDRPRSRRLDRWGRRVRRGRCSVVAPSSTTQHER
jgi:hypothetical protein